VLVGLGDVLGNGPRQPVLLFCPKGPRIIRVEIEQEFASHIEPGQPVKVEDDSGGPGTWTGKVLRVSDWFTQRRSVVQEPLEHNDVRTLECIVALDAGQPVPRLGQRMRMTIGN
jgi:hypothetical protein